MNREKQLLKNTVILGLGTFLPKVTSIVVLPLLTAYLTKEEYGTYDLVTVLVSLVLPTATLQIQTAAFRFLITDRENQGNVRSIISTILCFSIPVSLVTLTIMYLMLGSVSNPTKFIVCFYFFIEMLVNSLLQCARGLGHNHIYSLCALMRSVSQLFFALVLVRAMQLGIVGATLMLCLSDTLPLLYLFLSLRISSLFDIRCVDKELLGRMLSYSWPMVPNSMSNWVMRLSNRLVIIYYLGLTANAEFAVANKIPQILTLAQNTFTMAWQENASLAQMDDDADEYYTIMFDRVFRVMAGILALLVAFTPLLFRILIRGEYTEAYKHMPIIFMGMFFFSIAAYLGGIYVAHMRTTSVGMTTVVSAFINLAIDIIATPFFGLYGASWAIFISYLFLCVYRMFDVRRFTSIHFDLWRLIVVTALLGLMCMLCELNVFTINIINLLFGLAFSLILNRGLITATLQQLFSLSPKKGE